MVFITVTIFFLILTIFGDEGLIKLRKLYALRDLVSQENRELFQDNQRLLEEAHRLRQPAFTERLIRDNLGYVKPNEYILILDEQKRKPQESPNPAPSPVKL